MINYYYDSILGVAIFDDGKTTEEVMIYGGGNCLAALVYKKKSLFSDEFVDKLYTYFDDETHLKRVLGIGKKSDENSLDSHTNLTAFRLNKDHPDTPRLAKWLVQAKWSKKMTIELVSLQQ